MNYCLNGDDSRGGDDDWEKDRINRYVRLSEPKRPLAGRVSSDVDFFDRIPICFVSALS